MIIMTVKSQFDALPLWLKIILAFFLLIFWPIGILFLIAYLASGFFESNKNSALLKLLMFCPKFLILKPFFSSFFIYFPLNKSHITKYLYLLGFNSWRKSTSICWNKKGNTGKHFYSFSKN